MLVPLLEGITSYQSCRRVDTCRRSELTVKLWRDICLDDRLALEDGTLHDCEYIYWFRQERLATSGRTEYSSEMSSLMSSVAA